MLIHKEVYIRILNVYLFTYIHTYDIWIILFSKKKRIILLLPIMIWDVSRTSTWQKEAWPEQRALERRESEAEGSVSSEWEDESATRTFQPPSWSSLATSDLPKYPWPPRTTHVLFSVATSFAVVFTTIVGIVNVFDWYAVDYNYGRR